MRLFRKIAFGAAVVAVFPGVLAARGDKAKPFAITISGPSEVIKPGDDVRVHVVLTNVSEKAISAKGTPHRAQAEINYSVRIHGRNGKDVPETAYGNAARTHRFVGSVLKVLLEPGERMEEDMLLNKQFDLSSPGEYVIQLSRPVSDDPKDGIVSSNEITITVVR